MLRLILVSVAFAALQKRIAFFFKSYVFCSQFFLSVVEKYDDASKLGGFLMHSCRCDDMHGACSFDACEALSQTWKMIVAHDSSSPPSSFP